MALYSSLENLPKLPYPQIKEYLRSGDILFCSGEDEISLIIQMATQSIWSHVGIIYQFEDIDRILLLESVENMGVRLIPLSKYVHNFEQNHYFKGKLVVARCETLQEKDVKTMLNFGIDEITRPYDLGEINRIISRITEGEGKAERDKAYICSELVYECFLSVGIHIPYNPKGFISPEDIWSYTEITPLFEIIE